MCSSKKGVSSNQLHRTLGVTLKTAWFMSMRLREAMRVLKIDPIGGDGKFVEADETFVGGKARNRAYREPPPKEAVMALVERGGKVVSYHVPNVTAATLKPIIADALSTDSHFRTDESGVYWDIGEQFASHRTVVHSANEYVRGDAHTSRMSTTVPSPVVLTILLAIRPAPSPSRIHTIMAMLSAYQTEAGWAATAGCGFFRTVRHLADPGG